MLESQERFGCCVVELLGELNVLSSVSRTQSRESRVLASSSRVARGPKRGWILWRARRRVGWFHSIQVTIVLEIACSTSVQRA